MSDTTNRQAYVFLQYGDVLDGNDEVYADWGEWIEHSFVQVHYSRRLHGLVRRPITLPTEQTDNSAIVSALVSKVALIATIVDKMRDEMLDKKDAQPAEQPSETCRWKRLSHNKNGIASPHDDFAMRSTRQDCPTCGKKIEVVE